MDKDLLKTYRDFLKDNLRLTVDFSQTDQSRKVPPPPLEKPYPPDAERIALPARNEWKTIGDIDLMEAIARRESHRVHQHVQRVPGLAQSRERVVDLRVAGHVHRQHQA